MGAGYKTAIPQFVDNKMLQLPYQLMGQVLQTKDKQVDDTYASIDAFNEMLKLKAIENDRDRAKEIVTGYETQADEIAQQLAKDPLSYKKHLRTINNLSRTLGKDMTSGEWSGIEARYKDDVEFLDYLDGLDTKEYDDEYKRKALEAAREKSGTIKFNPETGKYNQYQREDVYGLGDLHAKVEGYVKGKKANVESVSYDSNSGKYTMTTFDGKTSVISDTELHNIMMNGLKSDNNTFKALQHRQQLEVSGYEGVFTDDMQNLNLVDNVQAERVRAANGSYTQREKITYADNVLGNAMQAVVDKYRKYDTDFKTGQKLKPGGAEQKAYDLNNRPTSPIINNVQTFDNQIDGYETFENKTADLVKKRKTFINDMISKAKQILPNMSETDEQLLRNGNFAQVFNMGDDEYVNPEVAQMVSSYKSLMAEGAIYEGMENAFMRIATPLTEQSIAQGGTDDVISFGDGKQYSKQQFDEFIKSKQFTPVNVKAGYIGVPKDVQNSHRKIVTGLINGGMAKFRADGIPETDLTNLVKQGVLQFANKGEKSNNPEYEAAVAQTEQLVQQIRAAGSDEEKKRLENELSAMTFKLSRMKETVVEYGPGADYKSFSVVEDSVMPQMDINSESNTPQIVAGIIMNGKTIPVTLTNVTTPELQQYWEQYSPQLRINNFNAKWGAFDTEMPIPVKMLDNEGNPEFTNQITYNPSNQTIYAKEAVTQPDGTSKIIKVPYSLYGDSPKAKELSQYVTENLILAF